MSETRIYMAGDGVVLDLRIKATIRSKDVEGQTLMIKFVLKNGL